MLWSAGKKRILYLCKPQQKVDILMRNISTYINYTPTYYLKGLTITYGDAYQAKRWKRKREVYAL